MKLAVINFSGNVGKTTGGPHLLAARHPRFYLPASRSRASTPDERPAGDDPRDRPFASCRVPADVDNVVVDIGASNVEELLELMRRYRDSQQGLRWLRRADRADPSSSRTPRPRWRNLAHRRPIVPGCVVFNQVDDDIPSTARSGRCPYCRTKAKAEHRLAGSVQRGLLRWFAERAVDMAEVAHRTTDYKALIAKAGDSQPTRWHWPVAWRSRLARGVSSGTRRLLRGARR